MAEATLKSGTLTTAAHATDQAREIFAIPGAINNPQSRGSNSLIRSGATLVESAADVLTQLAPLLPSQLEIKRASKNTGHYDDDIPVSYTHLTLPTKA